MPNTFAMPPEVFVEALYGAFLGRTADPEGLAAWAEVIRSTGDPTRALRGILDSAEYAPRSASISNCATEAKKALSGLSRRLRVVDVGAQLWGVHPYDGLLQLCSAEIVGFDPLEEKLRERAETEALPDLTLLPFALGDGGTHSFYINNEDATSSLFPLNQHHNACFSHLHTLHTVPYG
jgi:Domain of unknown function (DUF4214)